MALRGTPSSAYRIIHWVTSNHRHFDVLSNVWRSQCWFSTTSDAVRDQSSLCMDPHRAPLLLVASYPTSSSHPSESPDMEPITPTTNSSPHFLLFPTWYHHKSPPPIFRPCSKSHRPHFCDNLVDWWNSRLANLLFLWGFSADCAVWASTFYFGFHHFIHPGISCGGLRSVRRLLHLSFAGYTHSPMAATGTMNTQLWLSEMVAE